eukprot:CAMPEP_0195159444 /NCGR_PEP_ID=MMETSP0448-20130528/186169_1 /TAXON_ID=66468 /ORGANISM="Heterocapsa triquestra, Strain CCMP 448" /LENGTH=85 /DNA_ID=CAMNT_0040198243 /DNA_START=213 /DNA_END=470 /DNA_ORIENTATION=-
MSGGGGTATPLPIFTIPRRGQSTRRPGGDRSAQEAGDEKSGSELFTIPRRGQSTRRPGGDRSAQEAGDEKSGSELIPGATALYPL